VGYSTLRSHSYFSAALLHRFGLGPYRVAITIEFTKTTKNQETFILEMASLEYMPHSVQVFLEQVSSRLWDNTIFWSRPGSNHIITSATTNHFSGDSKIHHFQALGLDGVSFAEYSHKFPHKHYTVGFAGRGPTFYINTMDNIAIHGPGGQDHHDLPDSADPCFAKIVEGFDVVERMHALSVAQDAQGGNASTGQESLREYQLARIVTARILS
jgi:cyclophilin family peptidyl-prolyl cis-trans isomerase